MTKYEIICDGTSFALKRTRLKFFVDYYMFGMPVPMWESKGGLFYNYCWISDQDTVKSIKARYSQGT